MSHLKNLLLCAAIAGSVSFCENKAFAETTTNVNNFDTLYNAILNSTESNIIFDNDIKNATSVLVFKNKNGVIDGNGYSLISDGNQHLSFDIGGGSVYGNLTIQNLSIENFINTKDGWGGAVYNDGDLTLKNIKFKNNTVNANSLVGGGAITNNNVAVTNISGDVEFTGNSSLSTQNYGGGGAVYNAAKMVIHADGYSPAVFKSNSSVRRGGAIYNLGDLNLSGNFNFVENISAQQGGAIANFSDGKAILDGNFNFKNNSVSGQYYSGGAVYNESVLEINSETETNFISNNSGGLGGAVYNSYGGNLSLTGNFNFIGNKTSAGGAAIANDHDATLSLSGNFVFANNDSDVMYKSGGAIYNSANMILSTSDEEKIVFKGNIAGSSGGAIYNIGTLSLFGNFEFIQNENSVGNRAYNGGAIYNAGMMNIEGSYLFDGNLAYHSGGAIANYVGSLTIKGSKYGRSDDNTIIFHNNVTNATSEGRGGAIYIYGSESDTAYLNISNADFYNNTSNSHGGAIYVDNHVNFNVFDSRFIGNRTGSASSKGWGGAIGLASEYDNVYGYIENSLFRDNYSYDSGGAIPAGTILTIVNSQFFGNQAGMSAGAVSYNPRGKWSADSKKAFKLIADGKDTVFAGNWVGNDVSRSIANSEGLYFGNAIVGEDGESVVGEDGNDGIIFFNAGNSGKIIINDIVNALGNAPDDTYDKYKSKTDPEYKYFRADKNNPNIQLNKSGVEYFTFEDEGVDVEKTFAPTQGTIIFNNTVKGANLVLHNGVLAFGQDNSYEFGTETPTAYFSDGAKITLKGGTIDLANGKIESGDIFSPTEINVLGDAKLQLDIDVLNGKIDYINSEIKDSGASREGLLTIDKVNFLGDFSRTLNVGEKSRLQFVNANLLTDDRTVLEESLKTIITSNAGYALDLVTTFKGLDSIEITKTVSAGGLPVAISLGQDPELATTRTYVYNATTNEEITESGGSNAWDKPYFVSIDPTNVRHASNVLRGKELVINGNGKNIFTSNNVIGIELGKEINTGEVQTLVINDVKEDNDIGGWSGFNSALINNGGNVVIKNSIFKNNTSSSIAGKKSGNGGAIINLDGNLTIINSDFTENTATDLGGAIYNASQGVIDIISNNQDSVIFDGNSLLNGTSNAIHNEGTLNLTSEKNSSILFYDKISGDSSRSGVINVNSTNVGRVVFNETVSNQNIFLNSGVLQFGSSASNGRDDYFENVNLTLNGGTLNVANGFLDTIKIDNLTLGGSELIIDAKIGSEVGLSDYILANTVSGDGKFLIGPLNILDEMADGQTESHFAFTNDSEINSAIEDVNRYITINRKRYAIDVNHNIIHIIEEGKSGGFAYEVIDTSRPDRSFSLGDEDEIVTKWIGGDNHLAGMWFRILGGSKGKSLIAQNDIDGIVLGLYDNNPQQLDITGVTSYQGFSSAIINKGSKVNIKSTKFELNNAKVSGSNDGNGGVIKNISGTVNIADGTTFERNTAQTNGGAIFNAVDGVINFQTETDKDINFVENVANGLGNDIFNEGIINLNGNGKINITGGIAGVSDAVISNNGSVLNLGGQNEKYVGNFVQSSGTTNVGGSFFGGKSEIAGVLNWLTDSDIADGATLTFNGGNLNVGNGVNSAKLTIKGDSSLDGASNVEVKNNAELTFAKDAEIGTISGVGTLGVENSVLSMNENSYLSETLKFKSQNSSAILTGTDISKSDLLIGVITSGENDHLDLTLDNVKTTKDISLSANGIYKVSTNGTTSISGELSISDSSKFENLATGDLSLDGKVTNSGTLNNLGKLNLNGEFENAQDFQNNGVVNANSKLSLDGQIVNNDGDFNINGELVGNGSFTNNGGNVNLTADSSQFNGSFVQNAGVTNVSLSDLIFAGEKVINSGELNISGGAINYDKVKLGSNAKLSHSIDTTVLGKLDSNTIEFIGSGAKASFVSDNNDGNLTLGSIDNGQLNTISVVGNTISLSDTEFLGGTVYEIKNSELNLIEENPYASVKDYIFDNLKTENSKLSFNVKIDRNDDGNTISTDTLTANNSGEQKIDLANIYITGEENGQRGDYETTKDVLNGDIFFNQDGGATITGSTTSWIYKVTLNGDKTIKMAIEDYADNNTLYEMNDTSDKRFFQFSENDDRVYHIEKSLDETKKGTFNVNGFDKAKHILSGLIDEATDRRGDFFKVTDSENETVLNIKNITIKDAYSDGNGSVLHVDSDKATVSIANSSITNNESTKRGGAIYNESGNLLIENTDFSGNKSEFEGGAIYNNGTTKIVLSNFDNNSANVVGGAIFNSGNLTLISSTIKSGSNDFYQTSDGTTIFGSTRVGDEIIANNIEANISGDGTLTNTGILNLSGNNSAFLGNFEQTSGQTTISGADALFFAGTNTISGGVLNWYLEDSDDLFGIDLSVKNNSALIIGKDENQNSTLEVSSGVIEKSAAVLINKNSLFAITGSEVTFDENDALNGSVLVADGGVLNLENLRGNGKILGDAKGTINLISGNFILNDPESTLDDDKSTILETAKVSIANGSNLVISNGKVSLNGKHTDESFDDSDTWAGTVTLVNNGNLTISEEFASNGALNAEGGNLLLVNNAKLSLNSGSIIADSVKTEITPDSELVIKGGKVTIGNDDIWKGTINLGADGKGGTLNYNTNQSGTLVATSGSLNLLEGSVLNIKIPSQIKNAVVVDIQRDSTVNVNDGAQFNLDSLDKWNGKIAVNGGKLATERVDNSNNGGVLQQTGGETVFDRNSNLYISGESFINGGKTSILGGSSLHLGNDVTIRADKLTMGGNSMLNVMNGTIDTNNIIEMHIDGQNNVKVDLNPSQKVGDTFKIGSLNGNGTLNVSDFNFIGSTPIDRNIKFQIFDAENISDVEFTSTDKKILTPIGNYILVSQGGGAYMATLSDFNPQTYRGQVATLSAYNHQLLIDDMLTNHFILPNQGLIDKASTANKYASTSPLFAPYQSSINDGGLWTKSYVSFETLSMTHGLNVDDVVYGTLIGADLPAINLGQGWKFTPTGYVAYNGGNEKFNGVKITQNGGQGGVMGTVSKKNFIGSTAIYGGGYSNDMSVSGNSDSVGNWFVGTAIKTAYNIHASKKFIVQPTAAFAYNLFGSQNWKSDFGSISMNSGTMNGINLAPGVNLILSQKTWSLYGTAQYMFNINENIDAKAGNISVDSVGMRHGYVNYGVGVTKTWKEQLNSYLQVSMRNGGRTGVGFQFGLNYTFNSNNKNKIYSSNSVRKTSHNYKSRTKSTRAINS